MLRMRSRLFGEHALIVRQIEGAVHEDIHYPSLDFVNRMLANRKLRPLDLERLYRFSLHSGSGLVGSTTIVLAVGLIGRSQSRAEKIRRNRASTSGVVSTGTFPFPGDHLRAKLG